MPSPPARLTSSSTHASASPTPCSSRRPSTVGRTWCTAACAASTAIPDSASTRPTSLSGTSCLPRSSSEDLQPSRYGRLLHQSRVWPWLLSRPAAQARGRAPRTCRRRRCWWHAGGNHCSTSRSPCGAEKSDRLGGVLLFSEHDHDKREWYDFIEVLRRELSESGAEVRLNTMVDAEYIRKSAPDAVIIAVGAHNRGCKLPGSSGQWMQQTATTTW